MKNSRPKKRVRDLTPKQLGISVVVFVALIGVLAAIGSAGSDDTESGEAAPSAPDIDPAAIEATYTDGLAGDISDMCDDAYTHWSCFYKGVEEHAAGGLRINLLTDGGWSDEALGDMARDAAHGFFMFTGPDHEELRQIVVFVNDRDTLTMNRSSVHGLD